ncbi:hypothetical protein ACSHWO_35130 (plasmid) [Streptomyces sp. HUAS TT3]|uniref:hypothetical protein n=1 Tax=Streptomyces sp. HUAS TT3 TaxID=3447510 RepID=UPI003F655F5B
MSNDVFLPWGTVTPAFWTGAAVPEPEAPPAPPAPVETPPAPVEAPPAVDVAERIADIAAAAGEGNLDKAALLAAQLDTEHTAATDGTATLATADIREIRGYVASLIGDHRTAVSWYLHMVRLRADVQGSNHPDTHAAVRRAYSLWRSGKDPDLTLALGKELLSTAVSVHGPNAPAVQRIRDAMKGAEPASA